MMNVSDQEESLLKIDSLAAAHYRNGDHKESAELLRRALKARQYVNSTTDNVDKNKLILSNKNNLAVALGRLKQFKEAEEIFRDVLTGRETILGCDHIDTLITANHLGVVLKQQRKLVEAEILINRALVGLDPFEENGFISLMYAEICYNYGIICIQMGRRRKAVKYFRLAYKGLKPALGDGNPHTLDALHWEIKCMADIEVQCSNEIVTGTNGFTTASTSIEKELPSTKANGEDNEFKENVEDNETKDEDNETSRIMENEPWTWSRENLSELGVGRIRVDNTDEIFLSRPTWVGAKRCELCNFKFTVRDCIVSLLNCIVLKSK